MAQEIKHYIYVPFSGVGLHGGFRGNKWYASRIEIFNNYTLKSLKNQSNKNFTLWLSLRPEEQNNLLTKRLEFYLKASGLNYILTFNGLMYHDDKFTNFTPKTIIRNCLMMLWDCLRYRQFKNPFEILKYSFQNKNKTLLKRLQNSLSTFRSKANWIYLTRVDSDDMFHKEAINLIRQTPPAIKRALIFKNGYILNKQTGQVADWQPTTNPPFHTIIFPKQTFFNAQKHLAYYGDYRSHESVTKVFNCVILPDRNYLYLTHGKNISTYWHTNYYMVTTGHNNIGTRWNLNRLRVWWLMKKNPNQDLNLKRGIHPFIGKEYQGQEKQIILKQFGL